MKEKMEFGELDQYLFGQATHYDIYKKLGAHPVTQDRKKGVYFAVWAPNAQEVSVVGDFNEWEKEENPMKKAGQIGVWEVFVPGAKVGDLYKFCIKTQDGRELYKSDPYGNWAEMRPGNASRVADITGFKWGDDAWISKERRQSRKITLFPSTKCIRVPGENIRRVSRIRTDFTATVSLLIHWQTM